MSKTRKKTTEKANGKMKDRSKWTCACAFSLLFLICCCVVFIIHFAKENATKMQCITQAKNSKWKKHAKKMQMSKTTLFPILSQFGLPGFPH